MEKKVVTLAELKGEKVRLRNRIEKKAGNLKTVRDYLAVNRKVKELESMLLWSILTLMIFISGCHTVNGVGRDLSTWSSPYIENQE